MRSERFQLTKIEDIEASGAQWLKYKVRKIYIDTYTLGGRDTDENPGVIEFSKNHWAVILDVYGGSIMLSMESVTNVATGHRGALVVKYSEYKRSFSTILRHCFLLAKPFIVSDVLNLIIRHGYHRLRMTLTTNGEYKGCRHFV